jgi:hypothetical protein
MWVVSYEHGTETAHVMSHRHVSLSSLTTSNVARSTVGPQDPQDKTFPQFSVD